MFIADDRQLRDITFWMLGSLAHYRDAKPADAIETLRKALAQHTRFPVAWQLLGLAHRAAGRTGTPSATRPAAAARSGWPRKASESCRA